jgi:hypothetical protein
MILSVACGHYEGQLYGAEFDTMRFWMVPKGDIQCRPLDVWLITQY